MLRVLDAEERLVGRQGRPGRGRPSARRPPPRSIASALWASERRRLAVLRDVEAEPVAIARAGDGRLPPDREALVPGLGQALDQRLGASPPAKGAATHIPDSSPVMSRCQTTHSPSGVISPAISPTGSLVIWRRSPVVAVPGVELVDAALRRGVDEPVGAVRGPRREADDRGAEAGLPERLGVGTGSEHPRQSTGDLSQSRARGLIAAVRCGRWRRSNRDSSRSRAARTSTLIRRLPPRARDCSGSRPRWSARMGPRTSSRTRTSRHGRGSASCGIPRRSRPGSRGSRSIAASGSGDAGKRLQELLQAVPLPRCTPPPVGRLELHELVEALPARERAVVVLQHGYGYSLAEVARARRDQSRERPEDLVAHARAPAPGLAGGRGIVTDDRRLPRCERTARLVDRVVDDRVTDDDREHAATCPSCGPVLLAVDAVRRGAQQGRPRPRRGATAERRPRRRASPRAFGGGDPADAPRRARGSPASSRPWSCSWWRPRSRSPRAGSAAGRRRPRPASGCPAPASARPSTIIARAPGRARLRLLHGSRPPNDRPERPARRARGRPVPDAQVDRERDRERHRRSRTATG